MSIHQLQVTYQAIPDRLLLKVCTKGGEEYLAQLTRRFVRQLWPALSAGLGAAPTAAGPDAELPPRRASESFDQAYEIPGVPSHPLGANPLLVAEARVETLKGDKLRLVMHEQRARTLTLTLDRKLLTALCAMLRASVAAAAWELALDYPGPGPSPLPSPASAAPGSTLH